MKQVRHRLVMVTAAAVVAVLTLSCSLVEGARILGARQRGEATPAVEKGLASTGTPHYLTTKELREDAHDPEYTIGIAYPYLETGAENGFNQAVKTLVDGIFGEFKASLANAPIVEDDSLAVNLNSLSMDYRLYFSSDDLISVYFNLSEYHAGAAHPNPYSAVLNYSLARDRELKLDDLFIPGSDYLQAMSGYCASHLKDNEAFMFEEGIKPLPDNFRNWNIVPEGILVTFDPYQVAPYAAGFIRVIIPFSELSPYLAKDAPLMLPPG